MAEPSTKVDLTENGVLWMINAAVFHPRGLALAKFGDDLFLIGDGKEVWVFAEEDSQEKMEQFNDLVAKHMAKHADATTHPRTSGVTGYGE